MNPVYFILGECAIAIRCQLIAPRRRVSRTQHSHYPLAPQNTSQQLWRLSLVEVRRDGKRVSFKSADLGSRIARRLGVRGARPARLQSGCIIALGSGPVVDLPKNPYGNGVRTGSYVAKLGVLHLQLSGENLV
jgi:hypothetical protein